MLLIPALMGVVNTPPPGGENSILEESGDTFIEESGDITLEETS